MEDSEMGEVLTMVYFDLLMIAYCALFGAVLYPEILQPDALRKFTAFLLPPAFCGIYTIFVLSRVLTGWKLSDHQWRTVTRMYGLLILVFFFIFLDSIFYRSGIDILNFTSLSASLPPVLLIVILFSIFLYPAAYQIVKPLTDDQVKDLCVQELDICLPYDKAFTLCGNALEILDRHNVIDQKRSDPDSGTVSVKACPVPPFPGCSMPSEVTMNLKKTTPYNTHVTISSITPIPGYTSFMFKIPSGLNEQYVHQISEYLKTRSDNSKRIAISGT